MADDCQSYLHSPNGEKWLLQDYKSAKAELEFKVSLQGFKLSTVLSATHFLCVPSHTLGTALATHLDQGKEHGIQRQKTYVHVLLLLFIKCETLGNLPDPPRLTFFPGGNHTDHVCTAGQLKKSFVKYEVLLRC